MASRRYVSRSLEAIPGQPSFAWNSRRSEGGHRYLLDVTVPLDDGTHIQSSFDVPVMAGQKRQWAEILLGAQKQLEANKAFSYEMEVPGGYVSLNYAPEKRMGYLAYTSRTSPDSRLELRRDLLFEVLEGWSFLLPQQ